MFVVQLIGQIIETSTPETAASQNVGGRRQPPSGAWRCLLETATLSVKPVQGGLPGQCPGGSPHQAQLKSFSFGSQVREQTQV